MIVWTAEAEMLHILALTLLALVGNTRAKVYKTRFEGTTWDSENWIISTTKLDQGHYQARMSLANGYLGINVAAAGPFFEVDTPVAGDDINGWPLFDRRQTFATVAGFYDSQATTDMTNFDWLYQYGGESVISGVPHWAGLHVEVGGEVLDASVPKNQTSGFESWLDIRDGVLYWKYTWSPSSGSPIDIEYSMFVHKLYVNQAVVQLKMTAKQDVKVSVIDVLNGDCALRTNTVGTGYEHGYSVIWSAVSPHWLHDVQAYFYSTLIGDQYTEQYGRVQYTNEAVIGGNSSSIAQAINVDLKAGRTATVAKFIGGASSDAFNNPDSIARQASSKAAEEGYAGLLQSHSREWRSIMTPDSVDNYNDPSTGLLPDDENVIELAITAVNTPFHLLQNTISQNALSEARNNKPIDVNSISVGGLGSEAYAGWIFWDAEVWMAPGLVVAYPEAAKQIAAYRAEKLPQAHENVKTAYQSSQAGRYFAPEGAVFPWVSGRYGNCTAGGPCYDYEYHINGDIGLEVYNYYVVTGDTDYFKSTLFPIYDAVAQFYSNLVKFNSTAGKYFLYNATDPDEYANFETNVGFTMALMRTHMDMANTLRERFGMKPRESWSKIASQIEIPIDEQADLILEYQDMNGTVQVKQADVVLIDDFLDFPNPYTFTDLEFYAGRQSLNGPGMTYGVFSIVENAFAPSGCGSYTYDLYASQPYIRAPWFQFSEQLLDNFQANGGTHPAFPFLTGMGGAHRVGIFGYLGLRLMLDSVNIYPSLPPQIPNLEYRTFYWQGWPIKAVSTQTHTTLTRSSGSLSNANTTYANAAIPVTIGLRGQSLSGNSTVYYLRPGGSITVPNRQQAEVKTVPGNIVQCRPVTSPQEWMPGQFPLSAVDGAISTKWQPVKLSVPSSITVELTEPFVPVTEIRFNWAQNPPTSYKVTFSNSTNGTAPVTVTSSSNVAVQYPYIPAQAPDLRPYMSNTTNVTLETPVWSGRFATLVIEGNQALKGTADERNGSGASVAEFAVVGEGGGSVVRRDGRVWMG